MNVHGLTVERGLRRPDPLEPARRLLLRGPRRGRGRRGSWPAAGVGVVPHLCTAAAVGASVAVVAVALPAAPDADAAPEGPLLARPTRALALIGLFAFCALLSEGAVNDWAAVYLENDSATPARDSPPPGSPRSR